MLEGLFDAGDEVKENGKSKFLVKVNAGHEVFKGHFPGQPVLPGVAMVYLTRWLTERMTGKKVQLLEAPQIKFLSLIDPTVTPIFTFTHESVKEENGSLWVKGEIRHSETTFFKISVRYKE